MIPEREFLEGSAHPDAHLPDFTGTCDGTFHPEQVAHCPRWLWRAAFPGLVHEPGPGGLLVPGLLNGETFAIWGFNTCFLLAGGPSRSALVSGDHHRGLSPTEGLWRAQDSPK